MSLDFWYNNFLLRDSKSLVVSEKLKWSRNPHRKAFTVTDRDINCGYPKSPEQPLLRDIICGQPTSQSVFEIIVGNYSLWMSNPLPWSTWKPVGSSRPEQRSSSLLTEIESVRGVVSTMLFSSLFFTFFYGRLYTKSSTFYLWRHSYSKKVPSEMKSSLSMGGAINLIALFWQQQHNMSRSCNLVGRNMLDCTKRITKQHGIISSRLLGYCHRKCHRPGHYQSLVVSESLLNDYIYLEPTFNLRIWIADIKNHTTDTKFLTRPQTYFANSPTKFQRPTSSRSCQESRAFCFSSKCNHKSKS